MKYVLNRETLFHFIIIKFTCFNYIIINELSFIKKYKKVYFKIHFMKLFKIKHLCEGRKNHERNEEVRGTCKEFFFRKSQILILRLSKFLRYGFDVTFVESHKRGEKLPEHIYCWEGEYIVCF